MSGSITRAQPTKRRKVSLSICDYIKRYCVAVKTGRYQDWSNMFYSKKKVKLDWEW